MSEGSGLMRLHKFPPHKWTPAFELTSLMNIDEFPFVCRTFYYLVNKKIESKMTETCRNTDT